MQLEDVALMSDPSGLSTCLKEKSIGFLIEKSQNSHGKSKSELSSGSMRRTSCRCQREWYLEATVSVNAYGLLC